MMSTSFRKHSLALAISAVIFAPQSFAQEAKKDTALTLDAVQVTADHRVENIQDVPISISTISGDELEAIRSGGEDVRVLSARIPSLYIESSFGRTFPRFYIRGLGNSDFDLNASQPVSLILDDVVQENPLLKGFPMFDVEQVEVFRGPQGTMFGRNTPAGVVKFSSVKPTDEVDGYASVSLASYDSINLEGAIGGSLSEGWSTRLSALYQHRGDYVENTFTGEKDALEGYDDAAVRAQLMYSSDNFEALFNVHARDLEGTARVFRAGMIEKGTNNPVAGFDRDKVSIDGINEQNLNQFGASANLRWNFDQLSLISITGYETVDAYSRGDIDGGSIYTFPPNELNEALFPAQSADGLPSHNQFTQEFRLESNTGGKFEWQSGLYYFNEDIVIDSFNYDTFTTLQNGYARQTQSNEAWAIYASGDYKFTDAFSMRAGLRYTQDEKHFTAERTDSPFCPPGACDAYPDPVDTDASHVSWDVSGIYALNDDVNLYARIAEGFRAPAIQGRLLFGDTISVADTETVISYELGVKSELWDNRVRLGFNVYYFQTSDQQLTAVGGEKNFNTLINAQEVVGKGFELDLEAYLAENLLLTLGASYNDTEINDPNLTVQPCGSGCTVLDPIASPGYVYIDGNPLPNAPKNIYNLTLRYGIPVGEGEFFAFTDWAYRSDVNFFLYESIEYQGSSLLEGGLRIGYNWNNANYEVAIFGRNITDELAIIGGIDFNNLTGMINEPRTVGVEFKAGF